MSHPHEHPPHLAPGHPLWTWDTCPESRPATARPDLLEHARYWQLHRCGPALGDADAVRMEPGIPMSTFRTIHVWSNDLLQWVKPTIVNWRSGDVLATLRD